MAVALDWQQAAVLTGVLAGAATGLIVARRAPRLAPVVTEATIIAGLYTLWQLAGTLSLVGTSGAFARARWIEHAERVLPLPSELSVQRALTGNAVVAQAANVYYATMHFGVLFVFLLWLFLRHRDRYRPVRRVLALTTFACLLIQLLPVAPPRLMPGYEDTAARFGQSVYGLGFGADQLSAMPSMHVAWALLVGVTVASVATGPGRWLGPVHAVLTVIVVVATANHWWADGVVAALVLAASWGAVTGLTALTTVASGRLARRVVADSATTRAVIDHSA